MKKSIFIGALLAFFTSAIFAQTSTPNYPVPEFKNEVYYYNKDSNNLVRLEKGGSKLETKTKMGGMGGGESSYAIEGSSKSSVRFKESGNFYFVVAIGASPFSSNGHSDSMMRANGMDPAAMQNMMEGMRDPKNFITLYKADLEKDQRMIIMQKSGPALPFANHKPVTSEKYSLTMKKINDGYWIFVTDKKLPKGEYSFTASGLFNANAASGSQVATFSFGID